MTLKLKDIHWDGLFPQPATDEDLSDFVPIHCHRSILVTGAGGSIGAALTKAIHKLKPQTLVLLDSSEQNLYHIHRDLDSLHGTSVIVPVLGSVADESCIRDVFARFHPDLVYHAAALKHVPLGEMNPFAVVQSNVLGTSTVAAVAREHRAERLIMVSTDKSVNPLGIMGASKRLAEIIVLGLSNAQTRMTSIRLGNVLGSEGSVVPLFLSQIARGGPVTVTDPEVKRYFFTMPETVRRILGVATCCSDESAIAVPVMGQPVKICDLARYLLCQASAEHVEITFTGLRPGDKLQEEFIAANESEMGEACEGLLWVQSPGLSAHDLAAGLAELLAAMNERNLESLLSTLTRLVPEYQPSAYLREQVSAAAQR